MKHPGVCSVTSQQGGAEGVAGGGVPVLGARGVGAAVDVAVRLQAVLGRPHHV